MSARRFTPPRAVDVTADRAGRPCTLVWRGRAERVVAVEATWEEAEGWWRGPGAATARCCHRVRTTTGLRCLLYHNLTSNNWSLGAILD